MPFSLVQLESLVYREKNKYTHIWRGICAPVYVSVCVYMSVYMYFIYMCIYTYIYICGKAILRKIMMYFILDKRILSTSCQVLEA